MYYVLNVVVITQVYKLFKTHPTLHLKCFIVCKLYLNKNEFKKDLAQITEWSAIHSPENFREIVANHGRFSTTFSVNICTKTSAENVKCMSIKMSALEEKSNFWET